MMRASMIPPALADAYNWLDEGRLMVGILTTGDPIRVISAKPGALTREEKRYATHPVPSTRAMFQLAGLIEVDMHTP